MAVVGIRYNESSKKKDIMKEYAGVTIMYGMKVTKNKLFNSGDFVKDWYDCNKFIITKLQDTEFHFANSSSVDHFIMDGAPFRSAYLKMEPEPHLVYKYEGDGIEFFVKKCTKPTWEELRKLCGDIKKK